MDNFSLSGGPSVVNTGSQAPAVTIDPGTLEKYTVLKGATIVNKLVVGAPTYPTSLGTSYVFPEIMGTNGQFLKLNAPENKLEWHHASSGGGDVLNGGQEGPVAIGSTDDNLTLISSTYTAIQSGIQVSHTEDTTAGPTVTLPTSQYSTSFTNPSVSTVLLPAANSVVGHIFIIIKGHNGGDMDVSAAPSSGDSIDGSPFISLNTQYQRLKIMSVGNNTWIVV